MTGAKMPLKEAIAASPEKGYDSSDKKEALSEDFTVFPDALAEDTPVEDSPLTEEGGEDTPVEDSPLTEEGGEDTPVEDSPLNEEVGEDNEEPLQDYGALAERDLNELKREFPELRSLEHVSGLDNPLRYAALRDLGLTPREAYLATAKRPRPDSRAHLSAAMPRGAGSPGGGMTSRQLAEARELFSDLGESEIRSLYKKVTG